MSWVDLIIAVVVVLAGFLGLAEGAVRLILRFTGFAAGFFLGTLLSPSLSSHITHSHFRAVLALAISS